VVRSIVLATALVAVLVSASPALAQGGAPAPDFTEPCPALYPGDSAPKERIARWMARRAAERGLPHELPVMAALAESGLRNLRGDRFHGFFGMHDSLNSGEYRGFPRNPELQLRWFIDTASTVRQRRVAQLEPDPGADEQAYGSWIADVERPAPQNRSGYQPQLEEARRLVAGKCAAPVHDDVEPPRLLVRITTRQHPRAAGGIALSVRCPDADCLSGAMATVTVAGRDRTMRAAAIEPPERGYGSMIMRLPRTVRRELAGGQGLLARVTVCAADTAGNPRTRRYPVRLLP
jgi:hypothetical protein